MTICKSCNKSVYFAVYLLLRILAFSPSAIISVKVYIDGVHLGNAYQVSGPLYVLRWSPQNYSEGFHHIDVTVQVKDLLAFFVLKFYVVTSAPSPFCIYITRDKIHDDRLTDFLPYLSDYKTQRIYYIKKMLTAEH